MKLVCDSFFIKQTLNHEKINFQECQYYNLDLKSHLYLV